MTASGQKAFLVASSLSSVFLFSGIIFGWSAFSKMLIKEGYYSFLCDSPTLFEPCVAQTGALNAAYTAASTMEKLVALPGGLFIDYYGPRAGALIAAVLNVAGLLGMAVSKEYGGQGFDIFYYSLIMQAVGGSMTMFCGYQAPFLFPRRSTLLIECTSCLYDAGAMVLPLLKLALDAGVHFETLFYVYVGVAVVNLAALVLSWHMNTPELMEVRRAAGDAPSDGSGETLASKPFSKQVFTREFLAIFVFSVIQVPRSNLYMGSVDLVNTDIAGRSGQMGSKDMVSTITGLMIPFGFIAVPGIEACLQYGGVINTVQITIVMGWVYNALQLVPELFTQLAAVAVFAFWRAFLFSVIAAFNAEAFGPRSMGRTMGVGFLFSGLANYLQKPLINWTLESNGGDFTVMLVMILAVTLPLPLFFAAVAKKWRKVMARSSENTTLNSVLSHDVAVYPEVAIERKTNAGSANLRETSLAQALTQN